MSKDDHDTSAERPHVGRVPIPNDPPTPEDVARMVEYIGSRQTALEERIGPLIEHSVRASMAGASLTADEREWVKGALRAQAERATLRRAVIEKTLGGLIWSMLMGLGYAIWQAVKAHLRS